jgi:hypothetical protein
MTFVFELYAQVLGWIAEAFGKGAFLLPWMILVLFLSLTALSVRLWRNGRRALAGGTLLLAFVVFVPPAIMAAVLVFRGK